MMAVLDATKSQRKTTAREKIVPRTRKISESRSFQSEVVAVANVPRGNVKPCAAEKGYN